MDLLSDLIEEPKLAPLKHRIAASMIDFCILFLVSYVMGYFFGKSYTDADSTGFSLTGFPALVLFLIDLALMPIQEGLTGRTIGKRILKIEVLKEDFSDSTVGTSIVRHLFDVVDIFFCIGLIVASSNINRQRVGDLVAKTIVVMG